MLTLIYAANGNRATELANALREEHKGHDFFPRQISAYCGQPERCDRLIMLDPSDRVEADHKCEVVRDYASPEQKEAVAQPKRRGRKPKARPTA